VIAEPTDPLSPDAELALAWSRPEMRGPLGAALHLDRRLARIVARTNEPMLGQMRLAWWREALGKTVGERPSGDAVLDAVGLHWQGREAYLLPMVDAWEILVTTERLSPEEAMRFGAGRGAFFGALAACGTTPTERLEAAGACWALADAAAGVSDQAERALLVEAGLASAGSYRRFTGKLRGLAVLDALARRALRRGGRPLMEGRGAPLAALRAAIFSS